MNGKKILAVIMTVFMMLSLLASMVFAAAVPSGELGGKLKIKGAAAVGVTLSSDYGKVTPEGVTEDYVSFKWSRKNGEELTEVGTEKTYKVTEEDLGLEIFLEVTGAEAQGVTGKLTATTCPVAATEEEAEKHKMEQHADENETEEVLLEVTGAEAQGVTGKLTATTCPVAATEEEAEKHKMEQHADENETEEVPENGEEQPKEENVEEIPAPEENAEKRMQKKFQHRKKTQKKFLHRKRIQRERLLLKSSFRRERKKTIFLRERKKYFIRKKNSLLKKQYRKKVQIPKKTEKLQQPNIKQKRFLQQRMGQEFWISELCFMDIQKKSLKKTQKKFLHRKRIQRERLLLKSSFRRERKKTIFLRERKKYFIRKKNSLLKKQYRKKVQIPKKTEKLQQPNIKQKRFLQQRMGQEFWISELCFMDIQKKSFRKNSM